MISIEELKPCPFCGDKPVVSNYEANWDSDSYEPEKIIVGCDNPDCIINPVVELYAERLGYGHYLNEEEAFKIWNTRFKEKQ